MLVVRKEFANKGAVVAIRKSLYRMAKIPLDTATQDQLELVKTVHPEYVETVKKRPAKKSKTK